jgi:hypothetical protein
MDEEPMKHTFSAIACAALLAGTTLSASDAMKAIVGSYLEIHAALAADKMDGIQPAAKAIADIAGRMGPDGAAIVTAAKPLQSAADVKAARAAFGDLSDAVIAAAKADGWKDLPDAKVAYCPMVKKSWVQTDAKIKNPYYGTAMSTCGEFKDR